MAAAVLALIMVLLLALPARAQLKDETLWVTVPAGYKIDFQARQGNALLTEMVPQAETVKNWTEMVTTQVFLGMKNVTPEQFQALLKERWRARCKDGEHAPIASGEENGYPFSVWLLTCPLNTMTGKPEHTWFKAIRGNDSFYVVQKAFGFAPTQEQITEWVQFLRKIQVCDTRLADRPCPSAEKAK